MFVISSNVEWLFKFKNDKADLWPYSKRIRAEVELEQVFSS